MEKKELQAFYETQLENWELAKRNVDALKKVRKKPFKIKDLQGYVQFNPARALSTLANVDKDIIKERKCFLCLQNRPSEQKILEILPGWDFLVNPFPILPLHFTIVNKNHIPQKLYINTGLRLAEKLPGFVVFFNDEGAGASAPDHLHFQAVPIEELPLIDMINSSPTGAKVEIPFRILKDPNDIENFPKPKNVYFWQKENSKEIRMIAIPRQSHRPKEYYLEAPDRRAFSPGAIDMAGVLVTPIEEDFISTTVDDIESIYRQVSCVDD